MEKFLYIILSHEISSFSKIEKNPFSNKIQILNRLWYNYEKF